MSDGPLFGKPHRRAIRIWGGLAVLNLSVGVIIALQPARATDLEGILRWTRQWLIEGLNVYALEGGADYPPHAIVALAPLGLLPLRVAIPFWTILNLVLAGLAPYFAAKFLRPGMPFSISLLPILMFMCWSGTHTLLQFSLLALTFGTGALALADRRPNWSGVCLGLALMKPQVALPMFLWTLFTRRLRVAAVAIATIGAGFALFCIRASANPLNVVGPFLNFLGTVLSGDSRRIGLSELRPLIETAFPLRPASDIATAIIALALLAFICGAGFQERRSRTASMYAAPPLAALWSLLTFYHLTYGFVVLLPAAMLLALDPGERSGLRRGLFWTMQIGLMADVPGLWRRSGLSGPAVMNGVFANFDRGLMVVLFTGLVIVSRREQQR